MDERATIGRINEAVAERLPGGMERLTWPLEDVHALRDARLRELLHHARDRSSFHRGRLAGVDIDRIDGQDLTALPTMTKADLMAHWDEISCDPAVTLAAAQESLDHIARTGEVKFLGDGVIAVATGGSTGHRGVIAIDAEGIIDFTVANSRHGAWLRATGLAPQPRRKVPVQCRLTAVNPTHLTGVLGEIMHAGSVEVLSFPPTLPVQEIVAGLNAAQPDWLFGYASVLNRMADEARAGRLTIDPTAVGQVGEALLPEIRVAVEDAFGRPVGNVYGASESFVGQSNGVDPWLHLSEDVAVFEIVDDEGRPVASGVRGAKILVTNVVNKVLPLIRYELTDEVTVLTGENPGPWTGRRIWDPEGRRDDWFDYDGIAVHPQIFRSPLSQLPISEYQVRQTRDGADLAVVVSGAMDADALAVHLQDALGETGVRGADVRITVVETIERHSATAKLRRFVPLPVVST